MAIIVSVQCNGVFLPGMILLTLNATKKSCLGSLSSHPKRFDGMLRRFRFVQIISL